MSVSLLILEGLDGTGKTTVASKLIQMSTYTLPIHYIYFPKLESEEMTYDYFFQIIEALKYLKGVVVMDRSILSTFSYGIDTHNRLAMFDLVKDYNPIIVYFQTVYDHSKLPLDYIRIMDRYQRGIELLENWIHIPVIKTDAYTFLTKINSLETLEKLLKNRTFAL